MSIYVINIAVNNTDLLVIDIELNNIQYLPRLI